MVHSPPQAPDEVRALHDALLADPAVKAVEAAFLGLFAKHPEWLSQETQVQSPLTPVGLPAPEGPGLATRYLESLVRTLNEGPRAAMTVPNEASPVLKDYYAVVSGPQGVAAAKAITTFLREPQVISYITDQMDYFLKMGLEPSDFVDFQGRAVLDTLPLMFAAGFWGVLGAILGTVAAGIALVCFVAGPCSAGLVIVGLAAAVASAIAFLVNELAQNNLPPGVCYAEAALSYVYQERYMVIYGGIACGNRQGFISLTSSVYRYKVAPPTVPALDSAHVVSCSSTDHCATAWIKTYIERTTCYYARASGSVNNGTPANPEDQTSPLCFA